MIRLAHIFLIYLLLISIDIAAQTEKKSVRQGNREFKKGDFIDSEVSYRSAIELNPSSLKGNFNLGDALYKQEKFEDAAQIFEDLSSLDIEPTDRAKIFHNLGNTYFQKQKFAESVEAYKNALRNNPDDLETKYNLAQAQRMLQQQQQQQQQNQDGEGENDKNNDDQKENEQNKDQQDNQNKDDQKKDQKDNQNQEQQISPEDARRMLEAIQNNEQKVQDRVREEQARQAKVKVEKNW